MNPEENKMDTITLIELFQPHLLAEAEAAQADAEKTLRNIESETSAERAKMAELHTKLRAEIPMLRQKLHPLQECIRMKDRTGLDSSSDKDHLTQAEKGIAAMEKELNELTAKFPPQEKQTEEAVAKATAALIQATEAEKKVRARIGKAIIAHEAHLANPAIGVGPIPKFKTFKEAVRHFYRVGFSLTKDGEAHQACVGEQITAYLKNGAIEGMMPESLSWLGRFESFKKLPCPQLRTHIIGDRLSSAYDFKNHFEPRPSHRSSLSGGLKILCYVEDNGKILANQAGQKVMMPGKTGFVSENFSDLFGSWEDVLAIATKELGSHGTLDLAHQGKLPVLGEIIRDAWHVAAASLNSKNSIHGGQGRLTEIKLNELVGAYWKAFINSPWEPSIEGTYALLKHRCARGEIPNVYSFDVKGHFGFRVRTPDHDWIMGEIYCPPEHFSPKEAPDPVKVTNLESYGEEWLAELGSVKFCIRKAASRL